MTTVVLIAAAVFLAGVLAFMFWCLLRGCFLSTWWWCCGGAGELLELLGAVVAGAVAGLRE